MASRAISTATVSFGLVSIPVKLFAATESGAAVSFNLLHKKCGSRLKQHYVCVKDEETVPRDEMVKGFEFSKDQYVMFTPEEMKAIEEPPSKAIELTEFLPQEKIDSLYFDKAYFLGPDKGGDKAYRLLSKAMSETGRVGVAKYAARGKQYIVMLRPFGGGLVMQQLHYADEVRSITDVPIAELEVKEREVELAKQLIEQISTDEFRPEQYQDEVKKRIEEQIQRKVEGQEIAESPPEATGGKIIDLMEALKASLADAPKRGAAKRAPEPAPVVAKTDDDERKPAKRAPRALSAVKKKAVGKE